MEMIRNNRIDLIGFVYSQQDRPENITVHVAFFNLISANQKIKCEEGSSNAPYEKWNVYRKMEEDGYKFDLK